MTRLRDILAVGITSLAVGMGATYGAVQKTPIDALHDAQARHYALTGKYFQIIEYQAPDGDGYQIIYYDKDAQYSVGYGVEAQSRTFTNESLRLKAATSTP